MALRTIISTPEAPRAVGPYAQAVRYGDLLFVSGMLPIDPKTNELVTGDFDVQCTMVLENIKAVVEASGMSMSNVLKAAVFLRDLDNFAGFNTIYGRYFADVLPARETVQVARLFKDVMIEISVICGK
jgi:2-iminobutanoate/2-iminopropanoate deaminase